MRYWCWSMERCSHSRCVPFNASSISFYSWVKASLMTLLVLTCNSHVITGRSSSSRSTTTSGLYSEGFWEFPQVVTPQPSPLNYTGCSTWFKTKKKKQTCKHHCLTDDQETRKDQRIITLAVCSRVAAEWQWFVTDTASLGQINFQKRKKKVSSLTRVSCDYIISISLLNASMEIFCILTHI